jgi:3-oxoacyl-[acyl-carrier protein] reductase
MSNKIALVFGGTRGIGAACVNKLAESGFDVAYTYVSSAPDLPATIGSARTKGYAVDICQPAQVAQVFADVARDFGSAPTCVVANAGINVPPGPMATFNPEDFRKLVEVNIVGAFNVLSAAAKNVADGGTVIGLTTSMVRHAVPGGGPYTATKGAVEGMLRSMAKELAARKVRVNGVAPGPVGRDEPVQPHRHARRSGRGGELPGFRQSLLDPRPDHPAQWRHGLKYVAPTVAHCV